MVEYREFTQTVKTYMAELQKARRDYAAGNRATSPLLGGGSKDGREYEMAVAKFRTNDGAVKFQN